jgi:hypothetical protein
MTALGALKTPSGREISLPWRQLFSASRPFSTARFWKKAHSWLKGSKTAAKPYDTRLFLRVAKFLIFGTTARAASP